MYTLVHTHCYVHSLHVYTIYLSHIQHIHIQYTCIVTEMESCAQHMHTLMYSTLVRTHTNEKHVYTHSHTHMYIARKVYSKLVLCTCTCNIFHLTALCMYLISIPCPFAPCVWSFLMAGSLYIHSHHRSRRCEIKLSYWAQPLLNFFLFAMLSFVPLA